MEMHRHAFGVVADVQFGSEAEAPPSRSAKGRRPTHGSESAIGSRRIESLDSQKAIVGREIDEAFLLCARQYGDRIANSRRNRLANVRRNRLALGVREATRFRLILVIDLIDETILRLDAPIVAARDVSRLAAEGCRRRQGDRTVSHAHSVVPRGPIAAVPNRIYRRRRQKRGIRRGPDPGFEGSATGIIRRRANIGIGIVTPQNNAPADDVARETLRARQCRRANQKHNDAQRCEYAPHQLSIHVEVVERHNKFLTMAQKHQKYPVFRAIRIKF
ncbi:MAG: hypothetical protein KDJ40_20615 [Hyphomicrobiales bacterium]|nr:hypothetical protein [Hyphomicrobiales bacterium]